MESQPDGMSHQEARDLSSMPVPQSRMFKGYLWNQGCRTAAHSQRAPGKASLDHKAYVLLDIGIKWKKKVGAFAPSVVGFGGGFLVTVMKLWCVPGPLSLTAEVDSPVTDVQQSSPVMVSVANQTEEGCSV